MLERMISKRRGRVLLTKGWPGTARTPVVTTLLFLQSFLEFLCVSEKDENRALHVKGRNRHVNLMCSAAFLSHSVLVGSLIEPWIAL